MKVFVGDLLPGMKTAQSIFSLGNKFLLAAGTTLTSELIESLYKWEIAAVYIDMGFLPGGAVQSFISPATRQKVVRELQEFFDLSQHASHLQRTPEMEKSVVMIVDEVLRNQSSLLNLAEMRNYDDYLLSHSLGVCLLAVITAVNLGWSRERLIQLGLSGLLHDVGKVKVPPAILLKPGPLDKDEWREVQKHPLYALEILDEEPSVMEAASQHHENMDGNGYPCGLTNGAISEFARIIAIADLYDAMTTDRVYRRAVPVNEVLELIFASGGSRFDLPFVRGFVYSIAAYPVGSVAELSDQRIAVVSGNIPGLPLYPRVRILREADGRLLRSPREINLGDHSLTIVRSLTPAESFSLSRELEQADSGVRS